MIFNTFEWRTLQVAFLPYPKNAETGRITACRMCLHANMLACKHSRLYGYRAGNDEQDIDTYYMKNSYLPTSHHKRYLKE